MATVVATELEIRTRGAESAARDFHRVATASDQMAKRTQQAGMRFSQAFAAVPGGLGPAASLLNAFNDALYKSEGNARAFWKAAGDGALIAGAAAGFTLVLSQARSLSAEIDKIYTSMGKPAPGFWGNLKTGWGEIAGTNAPLQTAAATDAEIAGLRAQARAKQLKDISDLINRDNESPMQYAMRVLLNSDNAPTADSFRAAMAERQQQVAFRGANERTQRERDQFTGDIYTRSQMANLTGVADVAATVAWKLIQTGDFARVVGGGNDKLRMEALQAMVRKAEKEVDAAERQRQERASFAAEQSRIAANPQFADMVFAGSHQARLDSAGMAWRGQSEEAKVANQQLSEAQRQTAVMERVLVALSGISTRGMN